MIYTAEIVVELLESLSNQIQAIESLPPPIMKAAREAFFQKLTIEQAAVFGLIKGIVPANAAAMNEVQIQEKLEELPESVFLSLVEDNAQYLNALTFLNIDPSILASAFPDRYGETVAQIKRLRELNAAPEEKDDRQDFPDPWDAAPVG
jgi:hypothetical protein